MKRHEVMDLFWARYSEEVEGHWNEIDKNYQNTFPKITGKGAKVKVKLSDDAETFAYYYPDQAIWISSYGFKPSYFWDCISKEPLFNVTHWKYLKEPEN